MGKTIEPKRPDTNVETDTDRDTDRKTAAFRIKHRKAARKTSGYVKKR